MGPKTKQLLEVLAELEVFLEQQEETLWKKWMSESKNRILKSDYSGIEKLLSAYGGMGSFNDLVVGYYIKNGITHQREGYIEANKQLHVLRSQAYALATEIKQEVGR